MKRIVTVTIIIVLCTSSYSVAGRIEGTTKQLDGAIVSNVQINVIDLDNGDTVVTRRSNGSGKFDVPLPSRAHVSVQFSESNHLPAALVGISGDVQLTQFDVFLPALMKAATPPKGPCNSRSHHRLHHCR
jgi:hypothetical protein